MAERRHGRGRKGKSEWFFTENKDALKRLSVAVRGEKIAMVVSRSSGKGGWQSRYTVAKKGGTPATAPRPRRCPPAAGAASISSCALSFGADRPSLVSKSSGSARTLFVDTTSTYYSLSQKGGKSLRFSTDVIPDVANVGYISVGHKNLHINMETGGGARAAGGLAGKPRVLSRVLGVGSWQRYLDISTCRPVTHAF